MQMKFSQIAVGQRFRWQGTDYVKINSLIARAAGSEKQQLIPRYSEVEVSGGDTPPAPRQPLDTTRVQAAFEEFYNVALTHADDVGRGALADARQRFLEAIGL